MNYKREGDGVREVSRVRGNEVLSDRGPNSSSLSFSIAVFPQSFGRLVLLRGTPVCFRQNLHLVPCVRGLSGVGICLAGLIGCNRSNCLHIHIYIRTLAILVSCLLLNSCPLCCRTAVVKIFVRRRKTERSEQTRDVQRCTSTCCILSCR